MSVKKYGEGKSAEEIKPKMLNAIIDRTIIGVYNLHMQLTEVKE